MNVTFPPEDNEVETPYGRGIVWFITDYGWNGSTTYTVILSNGKLVTCQQSQIIHTRNFTFGRGNKDDLKDFLK